LSSDTHAGAAPEVLAAVNAALRGDAPAYGNDALSERAARGLRDLFETELEAFAVVSGTAANGLALAIATPPFGEVLCQESAHVADYEAGAPEFFTGGAKVTPLASRAGKLDPAGLEHALALRDGAAPHRSQPAVVSIAQANEYGLAYRPDEIRELAGIARLRGLRMHMDGARLANAVAALRTSPADLTWRSGVDVMSFGLTKNGCIAAEFVVVFDRNLCAGVGAELRRKRAGHLLCKERFVAAQLLASLEGDRWIAWA